MRRLKPQHVIILSFLCAILVGTALLSLPLATYGGDQVSLIDRVFTATSATCVTGLIVKEPVSWTPFGRVVIMLLFQIGGLGIMTFSVLFAIVLGRKITLTNDLVLKGTLGQRGFKNLKTLVFYIASTVFTIEAIGALALFFRWRAIENWPLATTIYNSIFHSISAFCNAGFSLFRQSFMGYSGDALINIIMISLIFIGGIGFVVILDLWRLTQRTKDKRPIRYRMSIQTKLVLSISLILIVAGAAAIFFLEKNNTLSGDTLGARALGSVFQSVTARTAGFNSLPIDKFAPPTLVVLIFLMFIGASPGSTGGGIKTCTFGVLLATIIAMVKNKEKVWVFHKTIPRRIVREALTIVLLSLGWIFLFALLLSITEKGNIYGKDYFLRLLFETTSAFGTVGLSTGITSMLTGLGKVLIIMTMFVGRIGPLTLALAVALREERLLYDYPEEQVMVG